MEILFGFDPGGKGRKGKGRLGWCVTECVERLPLRLRKTGLAHHAQGAFDAAIQHVDPIDTVIGAGIDAPLFWVVDGGREVDTHVANAIRERGCRFSTSTVQHINSLRGACLVQGILIGLLLRSRYPDLLITESHPKALLWMIGEATDQRAPGAIRLGDLSKWFIGCRDDEIEDERDAALATLAAWAMVRQLPSWQDLFPLEGRPVLPISPQISYWMPAQTGTQKPSGGQPMSMKTNLQKYVVPQQDPKTGCVPWGYEVLLRAEKTEGVDLQTFQKDFDLGEKSNNFQDVAHAIREKYPQIVFKGVSFEKGDGEKKIQFIEEQIGNGKPVLVSVYMKPFTGTDGCHIMIAVDADENHIGFIEYSHLDDMGNEQKSYKQYAKSELIKIHDSKAPIGNDVAFLESTKE